MVLLICTVVVEIHILISRRIDLLHKHQNKFISKLQITISRDQIKNCSFAIIVILCASSKFFDQINVKILKVMKWVIALKFRFVSLCIKQSKISRKIFEIKCYRNISIFWKYFVRNYLENALRGQSFVDWSKICKAQKEQFSKIWELVFTAIRCKMLDR